MSPIFNYADLFEELNRRAASGLPSSLTKLEQQRFIETAVRSQNPSSPEMTRRATRIAKRMMKRALDAQANLTANNPPQIPALPTAPQPRTEDGTPLARQASTPTDLPMEDQSFEAKKRALEARLAARKQRIELLELEDQVAALEAKEKEIIAARANRKTTGIKIKHEPVDLTEDGRNDFSAQSQAGINSLGAFGPNANVSSASRDRLQSPLVNGTKRNSKGQTKPPAAAISRTAIKKEPVTEDHNQATNDIPPNRVGKRQQPLNKKPLPAASFGAASGNDNTNEDDDPPPRRTLATTRKMLAKIDEGRRKSRRLQQQAKMASRLQAEAIAFGPGPPHLPASSGLPTFLGSSETVVNNQQQHTGQPVSVAGLYPMADEIIPHVPAIGIHLTVLSGRFIYDSSQYFDLFEVEVRKVAECSTYNRVYPPLVFPKRPIANVPTADGTH